MLAKKKVSAKTQTETAINNLNHQKTVTVLFWNNNSQIYPNC